MTSIDFFLGRRLRLVQPRAAHRAGLDAALLQAAIPAEATGHLVDLGAGSGAAGLSAASRAPGLCVTLVEREPAMAGAARATLLLPENAALAGRARVVEADLTAPRPAREAAGLAEAGADWLLMNPPYYEGGIVRASPAALKASAHAAGPGALDAWLRAAAGLAAPRGRLALIHRPDRLGDVLAGLKGRFGGVRVLPVHARSGRPAARVLVGAVKGERAGLALLPGLVLHEDAGDGGWAAKARALLEGRAALDLWGARRPPRRERRAPPSEEGGGMPPAHAGAGDGEFA